MRTAGNSAPALISAIPIMVWPTNSPEPIENPQTNLKWKDLCDILSASLETYKTMVAECREE